MHVALSYKNPQPHTHEVGEKQLGGDGLLKIGDSENNMAFASDYVSLIRVAQALFGFTPTWHRFFWAANAIPDNSIT